MFESESESDSAGWYLYLDLDQNLYLDPDLSPPYSKLVNFFEIIFLTTEGEFTLLKQSLRTFSLLFSLLLVYVGKYANLHSKKDIFCKILQKYFKRLVFS